MLFAFPVLFASVFLLNLEIIIRAVIIKDLIIPLPQEMAVLIDLCLNKVTFRLKDIQRAVYIVKLIGRFFQKFRCGLQGIFRLFNCQTPGKISRPFFAIRKKWGQTLTLVFFLRMVYDDGISVSGKITRQFIFKRIFFLCIK